MIFPYRSLSAENSLPPFTPSARARSDSSWFWDNLSAVALATFKILPRRGNTACVFLFRADFADPPALSPSTRNNSVSSVFVSVQSDNLPGKRSFRVADLRATSFSLRLRLRSSIRSIARSRRSFARVGSSESQISNLSRTADSVCLAASAVTNLSFVCPWNWGSFKKTDSIPAVSARISSAVSSAAFFWLTISP